MIHLNEVHRTLKKLTNASFRTLRIRPRVARHETSSLMLISCLLFCDCISRDAKLHFIMSFDSFEDWRVELRPAMAVCHPDSNLSNSTGGQPFLPRLAFERVRLPASVALLPHFVLLFLNALNVNCIKRFEH